MKKTSEFRRLLFKRGLVSLGEGMQSTTPIAVYDRNYRLTFGEP